MCNKSLFTEENFCAECVTTLNANYRFFPLCSVIKMHTYKHQDSKNNRRNSEGNKKQGTVSWVRRLGSVHSSLVHLDRTGLD